MATVTGTRRLLDISGNNISTAVSLEAEGTLLDSNGQSGTSNQVLISTATGVDWVDGSGSGIIGGPYLPVNNPTFTGALTGPSATITGNTLLGNSNGDYVHVNDRLFVGATDSGNAEFWFGEGATGDVNYGAHWHWDSGYTHKWFTVNNSSETLMMSYATNDTSKVNWYRDVDIQDNDILIDSSHGFINSGGWTRNTTPSGYIEFGPANTTWAHIYTDRPNFYFNKELYVNNQRVYNTGYHPEADKWTTARTLSLSGDASGSVSWDGSANATLSVTVVNNSHTHTNTTLDMHFGRETQNIDTYDPDSFWGTSKATGGSGTYPGNYYNIYNFAGNGTSEGTQLATYYGGNNRTYIRSRTDGTNSWLSWSQVWTSSTDGAGSGLDADLLDGQQGSYYLDYANFTGTPSIPSVGNGQIDGRTSGLGLSGSMDATANQSGNTTFTVTSNAATAANANTIAYRTSSADIRARLFRSNYQNQSTISGGMAFRVNNGADDYIRFCSNTGAIRTFLGVPASGDLNNYLLNTTDTFTGALTIDGELEMANGPNGIIYTTDDILTLSSGGKTSGTNIAIDDGGSVIKLNSDTIAQGEFKVSSLTDGTGDDVFRALVTSSNSSFWLGDIEGLGNGSYIVSDGTTIKLRNNGGINTLVTDNSNNVEIPNGNLIISNQIGVNTTNFNPQAGIIVNGNQTFGIPGGGANVNSRYLSIEGNADSAGEGSGRIFFTEHNSTTAAMDNYGMSLGYRGGATSIVGASGETWSGLSQIGNGEWGMWGHNNSANGALIMRGDRAATYVDFSGNNIQGITDAYIADQIIHTGDTNTYMQFHAADQWRVVTGGSERLEVNNTYTKVNTGNFVVNNNVGVGTTAPTSPIGSTRYINVKSTGNGEIILDHTDAGTTSDLGLYSWARNADHLAHIKASCDGSTTAAFISFHTQAAGGSFSNAASNERMRITSSGNVGIGTTSPGDKLHVNGTVRSQAPATSDWALLGFNSAGSASSGLWFNNGDGELLLRDDSNNLNVRLRSDTSSYINGGNLGLGTTSPSQKLTVNSGRVLISNTSTPIYIKAGSTYKSWVHHIGGGDEYIFAPSTADNGETWDWSNQTRFDTSGVVQANNFVLASDKRLKTNIKNVSGKRIKANWKTFEMIADKTKAQRHGVIAQELEEVHPEFVRTNSEGIKSVAYTDLLIAKIAELEARLEKLEK